MRAIIIDPFHRSVMETETDGSGADICEHLDCSMMQIAHEFETGDILYVDEEGMLKAEDALNGRLGGERAFAFDVGAHQHFFGLGLIVGPCDADGTHTAAKITLERLSGTVFLAPSVMHSVGPLPN